MLLSIYGDVILPHGGEIPLGSLVDAGSVLGISEQTARSSMNRLVADGWFVSEPVGRRSIYRLSAVGTIRMLTAQARVFQISDDRWNGKWQIIMTNPASPDTESAQDISLGLLWIGFGQVSEHVFIRPEIGEDNGCYLTNFGVAPKTGEICFSASTLTCVSNDSVDEMVRRAWALDILESRYKAFIERYEAVLAAVWKHPKCSGEKAFAIRSFMIHDFRRLRVIDPQLPSALLPDNWSGARALYVAHELYDLLIPESERFIMERIEGPNGKLPQLDIGFYQRFGGLSR
jgi:phenylacetic acid degradation operon negative regulatory protein